MDINIRMKKFAPVVLRIGISLVFLWFGSQQLLHTAQWTALIPQSVMDMSHLTAVTLVHINGAFEIVFALALIIGFHIRITALLLALHILDIIYVVGYGQTGVRDFGIAIGTIAVFLYGMDGWSLDRYLSNREVSPTGSI